MLPLHRREVGSEPGAATTTEKAPVGPQNGGGSMWQQFLRFAIAWVKLSWRDILTMAALGGAALGIYEAPYAGTRNFPITFDTSGDIVYPQFAYPMRGWIISAPLSGILSALVPIVVIALAQLRIRSFWDFNNAVLGLLYSIILGTLFQVIIKTLVGGFRPYWLTVCQPDISLAQSNNATGLNAVGFHQIMYTVDVCTNPDKGALKSAMTSFPSGHSTTAFAGLVFLFLWMNAKLKVWANFQASFYWLAALLAPLLGAVLMAACLTVDQAHNWYDIVAGSAIGTMTAFMVYRLCYAAVWDWRYNHVPLRKNRVFDYAALTPQKGLFVRKLGWGKKRRLGFGKRAGRGKVRVGSTTSSAAYGGNGVNGSTGMDAPHGQRVPYGEGMHQDQGMHQNQGMPHNQRLPAGHGVMQGHGTTSQGQDVRYPESAAARPNGTDQYYGRGDHMV